jgi:cation:H+ antiporter
MHASNAFEESSGYLGRNMKEGIRGATIEAIASSLPELSVTTVFLFGPYLKWPGFEEVGVLDSFAGGVATCAGSAVFNAVVIPGLCILAVLFFGVKKGNTVERVPHISVGWRVIIRDGLFFIAAELVLIFFLSGTTMKWWMGGVLMLVYAIYFTYLMRVHAKTKGSDDDEDDEEEDDEENEEKGAFKALITFDFNRLLFGGRDYTTGSAWVVLTLSTIVIGVACYGVSWSVTKVAMELEIPIYFVAVIIAAAATSVPDTAISVRNALSGEYDDAVSNAVGSNIFDICVALGLPLFVYGLVAGDVIMASDLGDASNVQSLRIALLFTTVVVLLLFLIGKPSGDGGIKLGKAKAMVLFSVYIIWTVYILGEAMEWPWLMALLS